MSGGGCELGYMETLTNSIVKSRRIPEGLPTSESENDENDSECSDDERPSKKSRAFCSVARSAGACSTASNPRPAGDSKLGLNNKSQKNNIWATVIQDQLLSNDLMGWSGLEQAVESDRDVESYNYLKAKEITQAQATPATFFESQQVDPSVQSEAVPDISEMETFGTASSKKATRSDDKSSENKDCEPERPWLKRAHNGNPRGSVHSRIGPRRFNETCDFSDIKVTPSDEPSAVADELMRVLREPDATKETFG